MNRAGSGVAREVLRVHTSRLRGWLWGLAVLLIATPAIAQVRGEILGPGATRLPVAVPEPKLMPGAASASADAYVRT